MVALALGSSFSYQHTSLRTFPSHYSASCPSLDLLLLVDSSGSVQHVYNAQKAWLEDILRHLRMDQPDPERGARVALIQFAGAELQKTEWGWDHFRGQTRGQRMMDAFHQVRKAENGRKTGERGIKG